MYTSLLNFSYNIITSTHNETEIFNLYQAVSISGGTNTTDQLGT